MTADIPAAERRTVGRTATLTQYLAFHGGNVGYRFRNQLVWMGELFVFVVRVLRAIPMVLRHYRRELWRLIAEVTFGGGILAIAASTILVSALLASVVGVQLGVEGLQGLNVIGLTPLTGLLSAFANTRELSPLLAGYGLAAQMGCKFTAQLGAMRVNEEIDALEVMSIPSLPYLVTTRLLAALAAVIPLYLLALSGAYLATQFAVLTIAHQGSGTYLHYFYLFLNRRDVLFSVLKVIVFAVLVTIVHCYYGITASGGPEGVGRATGRAIRMSTVAIAISDMLMTLLFWGITVPVKVTG
ncbi:MAG TPA: ABC transporter permease [Acidimicrobiales bacterium]|nr:ABC transporter permease [Acidimicrobiales bacterium]